MSSPVAERGYQTFCEPSGPTVKPLSLAPEAMDMLLHEWLPSMCLWEQQVGSQLNKLCGSFPQSCCGAPGRSPDKKSKIEKSAGGEECSLVFCIFLWKGKDVETQEIRDKIWAGCQAEPLKGLTTAVTETLWATCWVCHAPHGMSFRKGLRSRRCLPHVVTLTAQGKWHPGQLLQPVTATSSGSQSNPLFTSTHRSNLIQMGVNEASMDLFWGFASLLQIQKLGLSLSLSQMSSSGMWPVGMWDRLSQ